MILFMFPAEKDLSEIVDSRKVWSLCGSDLIKYNVIIPNHFFDILFHFKGLLKTLIFFVWLLTRNTKIILCVPLCELCFVMYFMYSLYILFTLSI